jgi:hypothetical protein
MRVFTSKVAGDLKLLIDLVHDDAIHRLAASQLEINGRRAAFP